MPEILWAFDCLESKEMGAYPPSKIKLAYANRLQKKEDDLPRAVDLGREVHPYDCIPIAIIANYGFSVRCPGNVILERNETPLKERIFYERKSAFGKACIQGDEWPNSDSGLIASWISGSEYVKIQTGIIVFFPLDYYLYQGPIPNACLTNNQFEVMAGIEHGNQTRQTYIDNDLYNYTHLNIIVRLPPLNTKITIEKGEEIAWFFPVLKSTKLTLNKLDITKIKKDF